MRCNETPMEILYLQAINSVVVMKVNRRQQERKNRLLRSKRPYPTLSILGIARKFRNTFYLVRPDERIFVYNYISFKYPVYIIPCVENTCVVLKIHVCILCMIINTKTV